MEDKIVDLRDCLFQLDISNKIRVDARNSFPPKTRLDEYEKLTAMVDEDITSLINKMKELLEDPIHEI